MLSVFRYNLSCNFISFVFKGVDWCLFKMICHERVLPILSAVFLALYCLPSQVAVTVHTERKMGSGTTFAPKSRGSEIAKSVQANYMQAFVCHSASQLWGSLF